MLIASPRHATDDLALWAEFERADALHGRLKETAEKAAAAMNAIERFALSGACYCGVSWGKDSVVTADLVCRCNRAFGLSIPLVWVRVEPICNPDCAAVRDAFLAIHDADYVEIEIRCGGSAGAWHATGTLEAGFAKAVHRFGTKRYISGIRADESGARTLLARSGGVATKNTCRPLTWWRCGDIFGWLAAKGLPVHPVYAMGGGGRWQRSQIRVASLGGRRGDGMGRTEWEREYYGDVLRRLDAGR